MNDYVKTTLANGLRLISAPMSGINSVTVLIMMGAGSRYETKRTNGISHFLEHMAFKGTKSRPSALAISTLIDGIGGEFNAFTGKDHTGYFIKARVKHLPLLLDVLSDMLRHSLFKEEEIEREKGVIIEEINLYEDTPARKIGELFEQLLYDGYPLGWDVSGEAKNIRRITRADFLQYLGNFYQPTNCVLAVAGGIEGLKVSQLANKYLGDWEKRPIREIELTSDKQNKPALLVKYKKTNQAHLVVGVRAYPIDHPKRYALSLLTAILGGGMSSRLFIEVRERRGLAYYVRSSHEQYKDVGYFATAAGVDVKRIDEAIQVVLSQYAQLRDGTLAINSQELVKAKEYLKGRLTLELEDSQAVAGLYAGQEIIEGKIRTPKEIMEALEAVTVEQIIDVSREIFRPDRLNLAVIGPFREKSKFKKLLSL